MKTVVLGSVPPEIEAMIEHRHATGADLFDEVWEGEYHMAPAPHGAHGRLEWEMAVILRPLAQRAGLYDTGPFNLGEPTDYRVPDAGLHRTSKTATWNPTAALVVEIVSPDDETWAKLPFYAAHHADEVVIVDPQDRRVTWLVRVGERYEPTEQSTLLDVATADIAGQIDWPSIDAD